MIGTASESQRGFPLVEFMDSYGKDCTLQCSSVIFEYDDAFERPGTSAVWLGVNGAEPMILASKAAANGVETDETTGWVPYPIPEDVQISTRMHLNREQVAGLISRLQKWLDTGKFA